MRQGIFPSFWMAGFECSTQVHYCGRGRLDYTAELEHDLRASADYALLAQFGMRTARDGIRWHLIERSPGRFDFSTVEPLLRAAQQHGVLVIWDICHYGWPDDIDPLRPDFVDRFARFAGAFARYIKEESDGVPFYAPMNETSFLTWAAGDQAIFAPFARGQGLILKANLVRATIAGIEAIWAVEPRARIVHTDPIIHVLAPVHRPDLIAAARAKHESQFHAWDMIAGLAEPQLGGHPRYLDILGFNYYQHNQWEIEGVTITRKDPRWLDLHELLARAHARYRRPFFIAETSGRKDSRVPWLRYVADQCARAIERGLPLEGLCLYPIIEAPEWTTGIYQRNGIWDVIPQPGDRLARVLNEPVAAALREAQLRLQPYLGDILPSGELAAAQGSESAREYDELVPA
ncbi:MAG: beta-glucosidase [Firmicutes bacterium]|nr:beta-glucosidase [Bacillota bacterium]